MTIKKIPFPDVVEILCNDLQKCLVVKEGANKWSIWAEHWTDGTWHYCIKWYCNHVSIFDSTEAIISDDLEPKEFNPRVREWYKQACMEMQQAFEDFVSYNFLEKEEK